MKKVTRTRWLPNTVWEIYWEHLAVRHAYDRQRRAKKIFSSNQYSFITAKHFVTAEHFTFDLRKCQWNVYFWCVWYISWNINDDDDDDDGHIVVHYTILRVRMYMFVCAYASIIRDCQHKETGTDNFVVNTSTHTNQMGAIMHAPFSLLCL